MGYDMYTGSDEYFRLSIWGMSTYRDIMENYDMITWSEPPAWPAVPEDIDWDVFDEDETSYAEYRAANSLVLSYRGDSPGMVGAKFCSNDGWHVTPEEIGEALEAYKNLGSPMPFDNNEENDYWNKWIGFLKIAKGSGGFKVY